MKRAYLIGALLAVVCLAAGSYYLVPGINHVLVFERPTERHVKHALVFFGLAAIALLGARFAANAEVVR